MNRDFKKFRTGIKDLTKEKKDRFPAVLGNKSGIVRVSGNIVNILTVPEGMPLQVVNRTVYNRPGALVMVGKQEGSNSLEVLYEINNNTSIPLSDDNVLSSLPEHASTHQYPSYDTVFIKNFQFLPLLCLPVTAHTVRVFPGSIAKTNSDGVVHCAGDTALDLSADVPASGACWEVIQVEDDGTISVVTGSTETDRATVEASDLPATDYRPIWAIVLSSDYDALEASNSRNDFWDLRFTSFGDTTDASLVTYSPAVLADWDYLADPGMTDDALDQLAARVYDLEIGGIGAATILKFEYVEGTTDESNTSATWADLNQMTITITTQSDTVFEVGFFAGIGNSSNNGIANFRLMVDGVQEGDTVGARVPSSTIGNIVSFVKKVNSLSAASHTFKIQWEDNNGTPQSRASTQASEGRFFFVKEILLP